MQYSRNSLVFDVLEFGPHNKDIVVLLHGFPANAESWQPSAELLANQGYHVLVPNQWCGQYCDVVTIPFDIISIVMSGYILKRNRAGKLGIALLASAYLFGYYFR